jgi:hypothetical protein
MQNTTIVSLSENGLRRTIFNGTKKTLQANDPVTRRSLFYANKDGMKAISW